MGSHTVALVVGGLTHTGSCGGCAPTHWLLRWGAPTHWLLWWVGSHTLALVVGGLPHTVALVVGGLPHTVALVVGGLPHTGSCGLPHTVAFVVVELPDITHCGCCGQLLKAVASRDWRGGGGHFWGFPDDLHNTHDRSDPCV